jgi:N-acetylglucosaminyl-diphospho-decaprenol L-rhamnosyltransferase
MEEVAANDRVDISISVVSHAQIHLIKDLFDDINEYCGGPSLELILTLNLEEMLPFALNSFFFSIKVIRNSKPLGFSANHNQAFVQATGQFYCVMNPDIRMKDNPFPALLECLQQPSAGVVAPLVVGGSGNVEDSARFFPTPFKIVCKVLGGCRGSDFVIKNVPIYPDWVGGMFMLFPHEVFRQLKGFNQKYFLYYEDVDLCARLRMLGYEVVLCPTARVIHEAQRSSHRSFRYLKWHLASMLRFFCSKVFLQICWRKLIKVNFK